MMRKEKRSSRSSGSVRTPAEVDKPDPPYTKFLRDKDGPSLLPPVPPPDSSSFKSLWACPHGPHGCSACKKEEKTEAEGKPPVAPEPPYAWFQAVFVDYANALAMH
jgi:hypothetical protein